MKLAKNNVCLDVSTWVRGPTTAVGLCAARMCREILALANEHNLELEFFSRDKLSDAAVQKFVQQVGASAPLRWAPFWRRWWAKVSGQIFVSFDHRLLRVSGAKKVIVVHDAWTLRTNPWQSLNFQREQKIKILSAIARADVIFCPSQQVADEVSVFDRPATSRIRVLPRASMIDGAIKESSFESRTLVMIATFESRKNHELAFRLATKLGPKWRWIFVGAPGYGGADAEFCVNELVQRGYQVQRLQKLNVNEIKAVYRESFGVVCPSYEEGFGLTVLEGLSLGRPVWASSIATHREVAGHAAIYFDPSAEQLNDLADQIKSMADSKAVYEDQILLGHERSKLFSWRESAERFLELIG